MRYWNHLTLPANRAAFMSRKIVQYVQAQNLDGVDIDLEWQYIHSWYNPLHPGIEIGAHAARQAADRRPARLVPVPGNIPAPGPGSVFNWVNMMVYDLTGPWDPNQIPASIRLIPWAQQCIQFTGKTRASSSSGN